MVLNLRLRYTRTAVHIEGIPERGKGQGMSYSRSACSALTRHGHRMGTVGSYSSVADALAGMEKYSRARSVKMCVSCLSAAQEHETPEGNDSGQEEDLSEFATSLTRFLRLDESAPDGS